MLGSQGDDTRFWHPDANNLHLIDVARVGLPEKLPPRPLYRQVGYPGYGRSSADEGHAAERSAADGP